MKTYILDTNVILTDPNSIFSFDDNEIIIPWIVLEELDKFKDAQNEIGRNARQAIRSLDELREKNGSLSSGIDLPRGGRIKVCSSDVSSRGMDLSNPDNKIINVALEIEILEKNKEVVVVSRDINMRVKCDAFNVKCQDYKHERMVQNTDELFSGQVELLVDDSLIDDFFAGKNVIINGDFNPNTFLTLKSNSNESKSALARYYTKGQPVGHIKDYEKKNSIYGLAPKNKEQKFTLNLLMDPSVSLVTLIGAAGTGKTLLALAAALQQTIESKAVYNRIIVTKPVQPVGKDIGFLPGDLSEKMKPWLAPITDNLDFLFSSRNDNYEMMMEEGIIQVEALTYIRGRSIPNSFIIIDEAQNISLHELKTIVTRVGENSKIVLTGDISQIDSPYLDSLSNGLSIAIEKFKGYNLSGHVTLKTGVRSELASLAAKVL